MPPGPPRRPGPRREAGGPGAQYSDVRQRTVSSLNLDSQSFSLRVSNPRTIAYFILDLPFLKVQISQGLGSFFLIEL